MPLTSLLGETGLDLIEDPDLDDRRVAAGVALLAVWDFAEIEPTLQKMEERAAPEACAAFWTAVPGLPDLGSYAFGIEIGFDGADRAELEVGLKDQPDVHGLGLVDDQRSCLEVRGWVIA